MTGVRITWQADTDEDSKYYDVWRKLPSETALTFLVRVDATKTAANWKASKSEYFYDDLTGTRDSTYQVLFITADEISTGGTPLFRPMDATGTPQVISRIPLNHDYGSEDAYKAIAPGGAPVSYAQILVFKKIDWDGGNKSLPVGITETNTEGRWRDTIYVEPGLDYVIQFFKPQAFGPTTVVVSIPPVTP